MVSRPLATMARPIAVLLLVLACMPVTATTHAAHGALRVPAAAATGRRISASSVSAQWLRADPQHPRTVYLGGTFRCTTGEYTASLDEQCPAWVLRSTDGGTTWSDLSTAPGLNQTFADHSGYGGSLLWHHVTIHPPALAADGRHLYAEVDANSYTTSSRTMQIASSADSGHTWQTFHGALDSYAGYGAGPMVPVVSPIDPLRVYALDVSGEGSVGGIDISRDGGRTWSLAGDGAAVASAAGNAGTVQALVPDPTQVDTILYQSPYCGGTQRRCRQDVDAPDDQRRAAGSRLRDDRYGGGRPRG